MTAPAGILLLLVATGMLGTQQVDDGFYLRSPDKSSTRISSQDGRELLLGPRQKLDIQECALSSQNNANTRFDLFVNVSYDEQLGPSTYVLVVSGTGYAQTGSGASLGKTSSLNFFISSAQHAKRISEYLKTPLIFRRHPRHNLRTSFIPAAQEFAIGDDVTATLQIANVGANTIAFMKGGRNRAARDNQYVFSARYAGKQVEDIGTSYHFGGLAAKTVLKPGDIFEDRISLSKWFAFGQAGTYEVHGSYYLAFADPAGDSLSTIWEDHASADFILRIKSGGEGSNTLGAAEGR